MTDCLQNNSLFSLLLAGYFLPTQVKINWQPNKRKLPLPLIQKIDSFWNEEIRATSKSSYIFNGELCRLNRWEVNENNLILDLGRTNYKELLYSNQHIEKPFGTEFQSGALGISAILISQDEQIILIKRSETVGESPGKLDVLGGHIHPTEHAMSGVPDPFFAIKDEIKEEVNLELTEDDLLVCIGLIETRMTRKPELIFQVICPFTCEEIQQLGLKNNSSEISEFCSIAIKKDTISTFLQNKMDQFSPSAAGALWLHAQTLT